MSLIRSMFKLAFYKSPLRVLTQNIAACDSSARSNLQNFSASCRVLAISKMCHPSVLQLLRDQKITMFNSSVFTFSLQQVKDQIRDHNLYYRIQRAFVSGKTKMKKTDLKMIKPLLLFCISATALNI